MSRKSQNAHFRFTNHIGDGGGSAISRNSLKQACREPNDAFVRIRVGDGANEFRA
jgi:hypothetical protein